MRHCFCYLLLLCDQSIIYQHKLKGVQKCAPKKSTQANARSYLRCLDILAMNSVPGVMQLLSNTAVSSTTSP